jgi:ABC-2 type transport system ATP-binding protein
MLTGVDAEPRGGARASSPTVPLLSLRAIAKRWRKDRPPVLDGVSLDVAPGTVVAVTGRNGAGKTTLLRIAAGLILADDGQVQLAGLDPQADRSAYQRRLGFLSAGNSGLYGRLRVEHHLRLWAGLAYVPPSNRSTAFARMGEAFALDELWGQRVDRLSMGQRQRVRLALAFLHHPELVLLDEPRTSLDAENAARVAAAVAEVSARGGAAVVCAPAPEDLGLPCDRHLEVCDGRLEER